LSYGAVAHKLYLKGYPCQLLGSRLQFIFLVQIRTRETNLSLRADLWSDREGSQEFIKQNIPCDKGLQALITLNALNGRRF